MKVLLDHCVPKRFGKILVGHEVVHTSTMRWGHLSNGNLLRAMEEAGFDAMVTVDLKMQHEQQFAARPFGVLFLQTPNSDAPTLALMADQVLEALKQLQPGEVRVIQHPDWIT